MIDIKLLFNSLKAVWITKLFKCDPYIHRWAQLANVYYKPFLQCNTNLVFNIDESNCFDKLQCLSAFYKDVLLCFNKAYTVNAEEFKENIFDHCLWGNKYIIVRKRKTKCALFFRNWIRSGVNKVSDLQFIDGKLNVNYAYQRVRYKSNIIAEIRQIQEALLPYRDQLSVDPQASHQQEVILDKSKIFYNAFKKRCPNYKISLPNFLVQYCNEDDMINIFTTKVILEKEFKLKEFNFKLLHGILPCNENLKKWRIKHNNGCDVCGLVQSLEHFLFDCKYVKPLWNLLENVYNVKISFKSILGIDKPFEYNSLVTIIAFLIYKEWLILSLENKKRSNDIMFAFFKEELSIRLRIYEKCTRFDFQLKECMNELITAL